MAEGGVNFIQSMTGYGRATRRGELGTVVVELRSTNHRYLEVDHRLANGLSGLQGQITEIVRQKLNRGRVEVSVALHSEHSGRRRPAFDDTLAARYHELLVQLQGRLGIKGAITLDHLLALPHLVSVAEERVPVEAMTDDIRAAVQTAVSDLIVRRRREAQRLLKDLRSQITAIEKQVRAVNKRLPAALKQERDQIRKRVRALLGSRGAGAVPQLEEALALIKSADVNEEVVRLASHLKHLRQTLAGKGPVGKLVDFIAQELTRETNTLGAKVNDADAARSVVAIKECIEKIREQAQNLE